MHEWRWDEALPAALLSDKNRGVVRPLPRQREDGYWRGELFRVHGGWLLKGVCSLQLQRECSRCLQPFWWSLQVDVEREFLSEEGDPLMSEDGEVDLIDVLREEAWLSWQQFVPCAVDCQPLRDQSTVQSGADNPFAALSQMKFEK